MGVGVWLAVGVADGVGVLPVGTGVAVPETDSEGVTETEADGETLADSSGTAGTIERLKKYQVAPATIITAVMDKVRMFFITSIVPVWVMETMG